MSQLFKKEIPNEMFFDFINKCSSKTTCYVITKETFKRARFKKEVENFLEDIKEYYFKCKQFYITRKITYKNFMTIIRQICKYKHLAFASKIKYDKSKYEIVYYIYPPKN